MKQPAKKLTLAILVISFLVGLIGCFIQSFDISKYSVFLDSFLPFYLLMVASVGTGAVVDRIQEGKKDAK